MNTFLKDILLIVIAVALSYFSAEYLGSLYTSLLGSGGAWFGREQSWNFIIGFPLTLTFFASLIFSTWIFTKKSAVLWLISPLLLWEIVVDIKHIYIPIILVLVALGLSWLLRKIFFK